MISSVDPASRAAAFRLVAPTLPAGAEVTVRAMSGRWVCDAAWTDRTQTGIGSTPRDALVAALSPLGTRAVVELLASPEAFALSVALHAGERAWEAR